MPLQRVQTTGFQNPDWVFTHLVYDAAAQVLKVEDGYTEGTADSPWYPATNLSGGYGAFRAGGSVGQGCVIRFRCRTRTDNGTPTDYSPWFDLWADGATMADNLDTLLSNAGLEQLNQIQFQIYMRKE
jgi:hypothetical protein